MGSPRNMTEAYHDAMTIVAILLRAMEIGLKSAIIYTLDRLHITVQT